MKVATWGIFDAAGVLQKTRPTEAEAQNYCVHHNARTFKTLDDQPYTAKPLIAAPTAGEVRLWCQGLAHLAFTKAGDEGALWFRASQNIKAFFGESAK